LSTFLYSKSCSEQVSLGM